MARAKQLKKAYRSNSYLAVSGKQNIDIWLRYLNLAAEVAISQGYPFVPGLSARTLIE